MRAWFALGSSTAHYGLHRALGNRQTANRFDLSRFPMPCLRFFSAEALSTPSARVSNFGSTSSSVSRVCRSPFWIIELACEQAPVRRFDLDGACLRPEGEQFTSHAFGDDGKTLYIVGGRDVYRIRVKVAGRMWR